MKPFKGTLDGWFKVEFDRSKYERNLKEPTLGFVVLGRIKEKSYPSKLSFTRTSAVINYDEINNTIETLNSIYHLGEPATISEEIKKQIRTSYF
jgi:hypothetical protein